MDALESQPGKTVSFGVKELGSILEGDPGEVVGKIQSMLQGWQSVEEVLTNQPVSGERLQQATEGIVGGVLNLVSRRLGLNLPDAGRSNWSELHDKLPVERGTWTEEQVIRFLKNLIDRGLVAKPSESSTLKDLQPSLRTKLWLKIGDELLYPHGGKVLPGQRTAASIYLAVMSHKIHK